MRGHDVVQRCTRRLESSTRFRVVVPVYKAHELTHSIAVIPWGTKRVLGHEPTRWENHEIRDGGAGVVRLGGQHRENGWVRMIVADGADGAEARQVVLVGVICAMPGNDVEGRVGLRGREEAPVEFGQKCVRRRSGVIFVEGGDWGLEVTRVREAVGAYGTEFGERKVTLIKLQNVAAHGSVREGDIVPYSTRNDAYLVWLNEKIA